MEGGVNEHLGLYKSRSRKYHYPALKIVIIAHRFSEQRRQSYMPATLYLCQPSAFSILKLRYLANLCAVSIFLGGNGHYIILLFHLILPTRICCREQIMARQSGKHM